MESRTFFMINMDSLLAEKKGIIKIHIYVTWQVASLKR